MKGGIILLRGPLFVAHLSTDGITNVELYLGLFVPKAAIRSSNNNAFVKLWTFHNIYRPEIIQYSFRIYRRRSTHLDKRLNAEKG